MRIRVSSGCVKLVLVVAADHIHIYVQDDRLFRHRRVLHETPGSDQATLFRVQSHENQRMLWLMLLKIRSDRKQSRRTRCVVIRSIKDLAVADSDMVVMSGNDDILRSL